MPGKPDESHLLVLDHAGRTARPRCPRTRTPLAEDRDRADPPVDRRGGRGRHADVGPQRDRHGASAGLRSGRRCSPRSTSRPTARCWPSPAITKCCCTRPTARAWSARLVGLSERIESVGLLARRQVAGRHRRLAGPLGRSAGLGRRRAQAQALAAGHLRHGLRRELVARRHEDRLRLRRQHACGPSTPTTGKQVLFRARTATGCSTRSSRRTART